MARKQKDITVLHGHHVVSGSELRETFVENGDQQDNPVRMRRRILHGAVLVLLVGLIAAAVAVALAIMNNQIKIPQPEQTRAAAPVCPQAVFNYTPPETIHLNVYNSTSRPGLARTIAGEFAARKFIVGTVDNSTSSYRGTALIVSGAAGQSAAFSVQRNVPGSDYFQDNRTDASVDVVLTGDFKELTKVELIDQTPGLLSCPREDRRIVDDPGPLTPTVLPTPGS